MRAFLAAMCALVVIGLAVHFILDVAHDSSAQAYSNSTTVRLD